MNETKNLMASNALTSGDHFTYRGETGTLLRWKGYPRQTRYGVYREAYVLNADNETVVWSLNMAGSVEIH